MRLALRHGLQQPSDIGKPKVHPVPGQRMYHVRRVAHQRHPRGAVIACVRIRLSGKTPAAPAASETNRQ